MLNLAVADLLFSRHSDATEGELTRARGLAGAPEALAAIGREGRGGGPASCSVRGAAKRGRDRDSILANAVEALFGAMYLDGGYGAVRRAVERVFAGRLARAAPGATAKDPKTRLQELLQSRGLDLPRYRVVASDGSAHPSDLRRRMRCGHRRPRARRGLVPPPRPSRGPRNGPLAEIGEK